jgi:hypothetical protein
MRGWVSPRYSRDEVDYRSLMKPSNPRSAWVEMTRFQYHRIVNGAGFEVASNNLPSASR